MNHNGNQQISNTLTLNQREFLFYAFFIAGILFVLTAIFIVGQIVLPKPEPSNDVKYEDIVLEDTGDIMYLIPDDETEIEGLVTPKKLVAEQQGLSIGITSDWARINQLVKEGRTIAVIIHHTAADKVNQVELTELFNEKGLVVTGIGIPGDKLASMIGNSDFYDERMGGYSTSAYYFTYTQGNIGPNGYRLSRATNDSFIFYSGVPAMLRTIYYHTLTQEEIQAMIEASKLKD